MFDYYTMGQRIATERKKLNITRDKLAELLNLSSYFIGQIERGARKMSFDTLVQLSDCLHISLDYLVKGEQSAISNDELIQLISRCSSEEVQLITDVLKVALPHLKVLNT